MQPVILKINSSAPPQNISAPASESAAAEATETQAVTKREAQNGDQIAAQKLRQRAQQSATPATDSTPPSADPNKGTVINSVA